MATIKFLRGAQAGLSDAAVTDGQVLFVTDERAIYLDNGTERLRMGDLIEVANMDALSDIQNPSTYALYYVQDINVLAKYKAGVDQAPGTWIQINPDTDTGATKVTVTGEGNAVTAASYDATSRAITLTKGATYVTSAEVDSAITSKLTDDEARLAAVEKKASANETAIGTLNGEEDAEGSVKNSIKTALDALDEKYALKTHTHATSDVTGLDDTIGKVTTLETVVGATASDGLQKDVADLKTQIQGLAGGVKFKGKADTLPTAKEDVAGYDNGDIIYVGNKEYIFVVNESAGDDDPKGSFIEFGDTTELAAQVDAVEAKLVGIDGTVTEYVEGKGYITSAALTGYAKTADVNSAIETAKTDLIGTAEGVTSETIKDAVNEAVQKAQAEIDTKIQEALEEANSWGTF